MRSEGKVVGIGRHLGEVAHIAARIGDGGLRRGLGGSGSGIALLGTAGALALAELDVVRDHFDGTALVAVAVLVAGVWIEPSTMIILPLLKYFDTNSAVWRQATTSMKSVWRSRSRE